MQNREIKYHYNVGLRICPLCGSHEAIDETTAWSGAVFMTEQRLPDAWGGAWKGATMFVIRCGSCDLTLKRATKNAAVQAWNQRVHYVEPTAEDIEEIERIDAERENV